MSSSRGRLDARIAFWLSLIPALSLTPFVVYHLLAGQWAMLLISGSPWLVLLGVALEAWRNGRVSVRSLLAFSVLGSGAIMLAVHHRGLGALLWTYPAVVFAYYSLGTRLAHQRQPRPRRGRSSPDRADRPSAGAAAPER